MPARRIRYTTKVMDTFPTKETRIRIMFSLAQRINEIWKSRGVSLERRRYLHNVVDLLKEELLNLSPRVILDAGCGDGLLAELLKKRLTGAKIYGVDISKKGLELAKKRGVVVKKFDLNLGIPHTDKSFDLVIANQVIEHLLDPDFFLRECERVLCPEGHLILTTPNLAAWYNRLLFLFGIYPVFLEASTKNKLVGTKFLRKFAESKEPLGHIRVLTLAAVRDLLEMNNFKLKRVLGLTRDFHFGPLTKVIYRLLDRTFVNFPSLSSDLLVIAEKRVGSINNNDPLLFGTL